MKSEKQREMEGEMGRDGGRDGGGDGGRDGGEERELEFGQVQCLAFACSAGE